MCLKVRAKKRLSRALGELIPGDSKHALPRHTHIIFLPSLIKVLLTNKNCTYSGTQLSVWIPYVSLLDTFVYLMK